MSSRNPLVASLLFCLPMWFACVAAYGETRTGAVESQTSQTTAATGRILFARSVSNEDGSLRSSSLFRVNADNSHLLQLTSKRVGIYDTSPAWSPSGARIAFTRFNADLDKYDIYLMDSNRQGGHRLTVGPDDYHDPVWTSGGRIAFIADHPDPDYGLPESCVGVMRADGSQQHLLFCPDRYGSRPTTVAKLAWSADGNFLYVDAAYPPLEGWYAATLKVDKRTGAATLVAGISSFFRPTVSFAPDRSNAIYSGDFKITRIDFASGQETVLAGDLAYAGLYSKDGSKITFTRLHTEGDLRYDHLFVMDADGSNVRQLTKGAVDNLEYIAADWSDDGKHLLVNRAIYAEDASGNRVNPRRVLRIIDVDTKVVTPLRTGYAYSDAWFQPN